MKNRRILSKIDKPLMFMCILFSLIGILFVLSASSVTAVLEYGVSPYYYFFRQILFVLVSYLIGFFIILKVPTSQYKKFIFFINFVLIITLGLLLVYGELINSVRSWIPIGPFSFQPSEFAKLSLIIYLGVFYGNQFKKNNVKFGFLIPIMFAFIIFVLVAMQPDLGTAAIIAGITFFIFLSVPMEKNKYAQNLKYISILIIAVALTLILTGKAPLTKEQLSRLEYSDPCTRYTEKTGYQVCNGFIAISGGGLFGKGLGKSTQKYLYLPAAHTDMIFPILVEEAGLIFGILVLLGYLFIIYRLIKISKSCYKLRNSIICFGVMIYILMHLILNLCGILALIPLTGVPMPFLSYGGSFTMNLIFAMFVVQRIVIENKITKNKMEIKSI